MMQSGPYIYLRTVRWGDCDPAGIIYTPRAFDYATEALEIWWSKIIGLDWVTMNRSHNLGAPTVHAECDYLRPLVPGQTVGVLVGLERIGTTSLKFRLPVQDDAGTLFLEARMTACVTDFTAARPTPIPDSIRALAEAYQQACEAPAVAPRGSSASR